MSATKIPATSSEESGRQLPLTSAHPFSLDPQSSPETRHLLAPTLTADSAPHTRHPRHTQGQPPHDPHPQTLPSQGDTLLNLSPGNRTPSEGIGSLFSKPYHSTWVLTTLASAGVILLLSCSLSSPAFSLPSTDTPNSTDTSTSIDPTSNGQERPAPRPRDPLEGAPSQRFQQDKVKDFFKEPGLEQPQPSPPDEGPSRSPGDSPQEEESKEEQGAKEEQREKESTAATEDTKHPSPPQNQEHRETSSSDFQDDPSKAASRPPLSADCDLWSGQWVWDPEYPLWHPGTCNFGMNNSGCAQLGREDSDYLHFRWQPDGCTLRRFNASEVRERLRGKRIAIVGDSLARNHAQSLICLLGADLPNAAEEVTEISGAHTRGRLDWRVYQFKQFNFTVEYYLSHFLVIQRSIPQSLRASAPKGVNTVIDVDTLDWSATWPLLGLSSKLGLKKDSNMIVILNSGHWWNPGKTTTKGVGFLVDNGTRIDTNMTLVDAIQHSMGTVSSWLRDLRAEHGIVSMWRSYSPIHFTGGSWDKGGTCNDRWPTRGHTPPPEEAEEAERMEDGIYVDSSRAMAGAAVRVMKGAGVPVIDISPLSELRPDGHPGRWWGGKPNIQDCSHWCLPGVPDTWNELMFAYLESHKLI